MGLLLFDLVLLAKVVHKCAPIYGLFNNHFYMFASVIFDAVIQLYSSPTSESTQDPNHASTSESTAQTPASWEGHASTPNAQTPAAREVRQPDGANIIILPRPDQAGLWMGLLLLVKKTIVSIVVTQFEAQQCASELWFYHYYYRLL